MTADQALDGYGRSCHSGRMLSNVRTRVYDAIADETPASVRDIAHIADCSLSRAHAILTELIDAGAVVYQPARYEIAHQDAADAQGRR